MPHKRASWLLIAALAFVAGGACVVAADFLARQIETGVATQLPDWLRVSLATVIISPLLILAALVFNRLFAGDGIRLGTRPIFFGSMALVGGVALTAVTLGVTFGLGSASVISDFAFRIDPVTLAAITGLTLLQAAGEETFLRGWLQGSLAKRVHPIAALIISALVFSGLHYVVAASGWVSAVNLTLAGIILGLIFRLTKGLAAPILFHFGWNWTEEVGFGLVPNPGQPVFGALSDFDLNGPALYGGGNFGLNGSLIATATLALLSIVLFVLLLRQLKGTEMIGAPQSERSPAIDAAAQTAQEVTILDQTLPESVKLQPVITAPASPSSETTLLAPAPPKSGASNDSSSPRGTLTGTHPGAVRTVNEDRLFANEEAGIWAVADGMGGHRFGDKAATLIVDTLANSSPGEGIEERIAAAEGAILDANRAIYAEAQASGSRMGSTVVALVVAGEEFGLIWAGDSRAYRLRGGIFEQLTRDHTQVQELVDRGDLTPEEAVNHPMGHILSKAVGVMDNLSPETIRGKVEPEDVFFLCSDGVYQTLFPDEIVKALINRGAIQDLDILMGQAVTQGARDNVTAIAVFPDSFGERRAGTEEILG